MKDRIKRSVAFLLAVLMVLTAFVDNGGAAFKVYATGTTDPSGQSTTPTTTTPTTPNATTSYTVNGLDCSSLTALDPTELNSVKQATVTFKDAAGNEIAPTSSSATQLALGSFDDQSFSVTLDKEPTSVEATSEDWNITCSLDSDTTGTNTYKIKVTGATAKTFTVNIPSSYNNNSLFTGTVADVPWNGANSKAKVTVYRDNVSVEEGELDSDITVQGTLSSTAYNYSFIVENDNYKMSNTVAMVEGNTKDGNFKSEDLANVNSTSIALVPNISNFAISDDGGSVTTGTAQNYSVTGSVPDAWKNKVTWSVSAVDNDGNSVNNTCAASITSGTGGTASITFNKQTTNNVEYVKLTATIPNTNVLAEKIIVVSKASTSLVINDIDPVNTESWNTPRTITATLKSGDTPLERQDITFTIESTDGSAFTDSGVQTISENSTITVKTDAQGIATVHAMFNVAQEYTISAVYNGNNSYQEKNSSKQTGSLGKANGTISINTIDSAAYLTYGTNFGENITLTNGNKNISEDIININSAVQIRGTQGIVSASVTGDKNTGYRLILTPLKSGETKVELDFETANYKFTKEIAVNVAKKNINVKEINVSDAEAENYNNTKTYDGDGIVDLKVTVDGVSDTDKAVYLGGNSYFIMRNVNSEVVNVNKTQSEQSFSPTIEIPSNSYSEFDARYNVQNSNNIQAKIKIDPAPLCVDIGNADRAFRDFTYYDLNNQTVNLSNLIESVTGFIGDTDEASFKTANSSYQRPEIIEIGRAASPANDTQTLGKKTDILEVKPNSGTPTDNYYFVTRERGDVDIISEKVDTYTAAISKGYLAVDTANSRNVYSDGNQIFYGPSTDSANPTKVKFNLNGGYNGLCSVDDNAYTKIDAETISLAKSADNFEKAVGLARINVNNAEMTTTPFNIPFVYDNIAPEVDIQIKNTAATKTLDKFKELISFGFFSNTTLTAEVSISDNAAGIAGVSYFKGSLNDLTNITYEEYLGRNENQFQQWSLDAAQEAEGTYTFSESLGNDTNSTIDYDNYILFVRVTDKVGNTVTVASNGAIIEKYDYSDCDISFYAIAKNEGTKRAEKDGVVYINDDATLNISATETGTKKSGIKSITYKFRVEGENNEQEYTIYPSINTEQNPDFVPNVTLSKLDELTTLKGTKDFTKNDGASKAITVTSATVMDYAGNKKEFTPNYKFVIDAKPPQVEASLSNNYSNDKYYNSDVVYTANITERYIDNNNNIAITFVKDSQTFTYSLSALKNKTDDQLLNELGVSKLDISGNTLISERTDSSVTTVEITFSKDTEGSYKISTSATDYTVTTVATAGKEFIIDTTSPTVEAHYKLVPKEGSESVFGTVGQENASCQYAGESVDKIKVTLRVKDVNFAAQGANLNIVPENVPEGQTVTIPNVKEENQWTLKDGWHVCEIVLDVDANYTLDFSFTDLANNMSSIPQALFTLDRVRPTGTITASNLVNTETIDNHKSIWSRIVEDLTFGIIHNKTFGFFAKEKVDIALESADVTAQVDYIQYYLSRKVIKNRSELNAIKDDTAEGVEALEKWSKKYTSGRHSFSISEDNGQIDDEQIVYLKVTDKAGNIEYFSTDTIIVDDTDTAPTVKLNPDIPLNNKGVYRADDKPGFDIDVKDVTNNGTFSGLKSVTYTVLNGDTQESTEKTIEWDSTGTSSGENQPKTPVETYKEHIYIDEIVGGLKKFNSNDVQIYVTVSDWAGNETRSNVKTLKIDLDAPVITYEFDTSDALNGKYYKNTKTLKITVDERNFDTTYVPEVKSSLGGGYTFSGWSDDENGNHVGTVTFSGDSDYTVNFDCYDLAGNHAVKPMDTLVFTVDKTLPVVSSKYTAMMKDGTKNEFIPGTEEAKRFYNGEDVSYIDVEMTVYEKDFGIAGQALTDKLTLTAKELGTGQTIDVTAYDTAAKDVSKWSQTAQYTHVQHFALSTDANYTLEFTFTDLAGNTSVPYAKQFFTLDRVRPTGTVTVNDLVGKGSVTWNKLLSAITFGFFGNTSASADFTGADVTAGVSDISYFISRDLLDRAGLDKVPASAWTSGTRAPLGANYQFIVYEKVTDKSGNYEYFSSENLVMDNTDPAPVVTITPSAPSWNKGVYRAEDNPGFDVSVTDPYVNDSYSGLKQITYKIVNGTTGHTETGTLASYAESAHQQSWSGHVTIDPNAFYSNDVQVTVTATDWSANETTSEQKTLKVDNKAPEVSFSFDTSDASNAKYYKNNKTLTITVNERNFDTTYTPEVTSTAGGGYSFGGWSSNGEVHTGTVTFTGDSDYTVKFDCYDLAGNHSNTETLDEFTVDKTLPTVSVSYDNTSAQNTKYYKAGRTATITITEHNFRATEVRVTTTATLNGASVKAPTVGGWSSSGDRHTATISYSSDADYTFDIEYSDLAGNAMADYTQESFTVDLTNPEVSIAGIEDKSANKGTVAPVITLTDTNYTADGVTLTLIGVNKGKVNADTMVTRSQTANGQIITFRNFGDDMDDIYTLTAKSVDRAGNETSKSVTFSVNRNGSTYILSDALSKLIESGFTNKPANIVIQEVNVDTLEFIEITYSKDGSVVTLKEGEDYSVDVEGAANQWKKYTYTIFASCFEEEGAYSINIYSEDRAENTTNNRIKSNTIEFVVDKTAPTVSIANLENRGRYKENIHQFTMSVKDNMLLAYVELYLDGELVHKYDIDELEVVNGELVIDVNSKDAYQNVKIVAYDAAGNPTDPFEYEVLVTSNWWVQFFLNRPLFFGTIAAIIAVIGGIIFIIVKRKKKNETNSAGK